MMIMKNDKYANVNNFVLIFFTLLKIKCFIYSLSHTKQKA